MPQVTLQLPPELWHHVFGYLSPEDKSRVRASSRYFKKLIDRSSLWKNWTVVLNFTKPSYNSQFWATLRRRRAGSVVVRSAKAKDWTLLAQSLPALSTVVVETPKNLDGLKNFPGLKRLALRACYGASLLPDAFTVSQPQQLTHLSICDVTLSTTAADDFMSTLSRFTNLKSLVCHRVGIFKDTVLTIHSLLSCLPKLKHLSLSVVTREYLDDLVPTAKPGALGQAHALSSLEFIDCVDHSLAEDMMRLVPGLKRLAIFYKYPRREMLARWPSPVYHLKTWLSDLPQLSSLVIVHSPPVDSYVTCIPATLNNFTLCVEEFSLHEMEAVSVQLPELLHLHIDTWPSHLDAHTAQIPQLFPKLQSLKVCHKHVPVTDFLHLHQLQHLRYLVVLDTGPHLSALIRKLQELTNYRLKTSPRQRDLLSCPCVDRVY